MANQESRLLTIVGPGTQARKSKVGLVEFYPRKRTRRESDKAFTPKVSPSDEHRGDKFTFWDSERYRWSGVAKRKAMSGVSTPPPQPISALSDFQLLSSSSISSSSISSSSVSSSSSRPRPMQDLPDFELWKIAEQDASTRQRAKALEELIRREVPEVAAFVLEELQKGDLKPTWRNTLVFATEHLQFTEPEQRGKLRERLRKLVAEINDESHPRSRLAQEAALRRWGSLLDDKTQLRETVELLATTYPLSVRLIALQTIQNAFEMEPPSTVTYDALESLRDELAATASYLLRVAVLERSEEDFDIGLTALEALVRLGDRRALEHVTQCGSMGRRWIVKQTGRFLQETLAAWTRTEVNSSSDAVAVVREALDLLSAVR